MQNITVVSCIPVVYYTTLTGVCHTTLHLQVCTTLHLQVYATPHYTYRCMPHHTTLTGVCHTTLHLQVCATLHLHYTRYSTMYCTFYQFQQFSTGYFCTSGLTLAILDLITSSSEDNLRLAIIC